MEDDIYNKTLFNICEIDQFLYMVKLLTVRRGSRDPSLGLLVERQPFTRHISI